MTIANPFAAKVDDISSITATEITNCGVGLAKALDGTNGGTYSLASILTLNGSGLSVGTDGGAGLVTVRNTGAFTRAGSAATYTERLDLTSATAAADALLTVASDTYICVTPTGADKYHGLSNTGAVAGMRVLIKRKAAGAFNIIIRRNATGAGAAIVTLPSATASSCMFEFDGTNWVGLMTDGGTKGADWD